MRRRTRPPGAGRDDFSCGDKFAAEVKHLNTIVATIVRINQPTTSVDTRDRTTWRVDFVLSGIAAAACRGQP